MPFDAIDENTTLPKSVTAETVLDVKHWTDRLFSFSITRPGSFRFRSGEFIMIGLMVNGKPLLRAYSVASPSWDEKLDFYSIKVEDGPLTSRLQHIKPGDKILLGKKPTGTLVVDALLPGKRLYMLSTGTGIAPFASLIRDPEVYEKFDQVILTHTCREVAELEYGKQLVKDVMDDPLIGEMAQEKLVHYTSATREDYPVKGRITELVESGKLFEDLGVPKFDPEIDRIMICGSTDMLKSCKQMSLDHGFHEGSNAAPSQFVIEKAFAD
ncbi:ferredoxin--NADP reductase [Curvivirga sp.]|uniref:ferredoxin--NADP reductase n=1 Tax=Curvivirga sp. TaxID=2856848 RepID=UPI003B596AC9